MTQVAPLHAVGHQEVFGLRVEGNRGAVRTRLAYVVDRADRPARLDDPADDPVGRAREGGTYGDPNPIAELDFLRVVDPVCDVGDEEVVPQARAVGADEAADELLDFRSPRKGVLHVCLPSDEVSRVLVGPGSIDGLDVPVVGVRWKDEVVADRLARGIDQLAPDDRVGFGLIPALPNDQPATVTPGRHAGRGRATRAPGRDVGRKGDGRCLQRTVSRSEPDLEQAVVRLYLRRHEYGQGLAGRRVVGDRRPASGRGVVGRIERCQLFDRVDRSGLGQAGSGE